MALNSNTNPQLVYGISNEPVTVQIIAIHRHNGQTHDL